MRRYGLAGTAAILGLLGGGTALAGAEGDYKEPVVKILGPQGKLNFEIRPRDSCDVFDPVEIRIRFRGEGFKKTFVLDEPCGDWTRGSKSAPSLRFSREDGTGEKAGRLKLKAVGDKPVKRKYRYDIRVDGKTTQSGIMRVEVREGDGGDVERYVYLDE